MLYKSNYFTQISPTESEWVNSFKAAGDNLVKQIRNGTVVIEGHTRKDGVLESPQISQGEIDV